MIRFACPGCESVFTVGDEKAGKTGKCPKCEARFQIPDAEDAPSEAPERTKRPSVPPPSPLNADPSEAVEIKPCTGCNARLSVTRADLGADVECPYCQAVYEAVDAAAPAPRPSGSGSRSKLREVADEEPAAPPRRRRQPEPERDEGERPVRRSRGRMSAEDDDEEETPVRRGKSRSRDDDGDDDDDYLPRRKSRGRSRRHSSSGEAGPWRVIAGVLSVLISVGTGACGICVAGFSTFMIAALSKSSNAPALAGWGVGLFVGCGFLLMLVAALYMIAGVGAFNRKSYGRILLIITGVLSTLLALAGFYGIFQSLMIGEAMGILSNLVFVLLYAGHAGTAFMGTFPAAAAAEYIN